jgi:hypothetical protein
MHNLSATILVIIVNTDYKIGEIVETKDVTFAESS